MAMRWPFRSRRRRLLAALALLLGLALAPPTLFQALVWWWPYPEADGRMPPPATLVLDREGHALAAFASSAGQWYLPLRAEDLPGTLRDAVVAVEDHRFRSHAGVDWTAIAAALWQDLASGRVVRGASTITMQLQRLRDPRPRTLASKGREAVRAAQLESRLGKDAILAEYLDRAPFGANVVGAGAASWRWFGVPCRALSLGQAALLAGLPQNPARLRPDRHPEAARARRDHVLARMLACGFIDEPQRAAAAAEPVVLAPELLPQAGTPGGAAGVAACLDLAAEGPGGELATTLDAAMQAQAQAAAAGCLERLRGDGVEAAAVVVVDTPSAACRAVVSCGGPGFLDLTRVRRSTGSTLKPFIYAIAFADDVCAPGTILADDAAAWGGYAPANYDHAFRGRLTAVEALAESRNLPAMQLLARIGLARAGGAMEACGLAGLASAAPRAGLTLAIGGAECSPRQLAAAYTALARGGIAAELRLGGGPPSAPPHRCLPEAACWQVLAALADGERTAAVDQAAARRGVAWKTGTSSGHRDAWCAAATPRFTVVAWLGTVAGKGSAALVGQQAAAPLALGLIAALDQGGPGWPHPDTPPAAAPARPVLAAPLAIASPTAGTEILVDRSLPAGSQRVALRSLGGTAGDRWWFDAGELVGTCAAAGQLWWSPAPGRHALRVVDAAGHAAATEVLVR